MTNRYEEVQQTIDELKSLNTMMVSIQNKISALKSKTIIVKSMSKVNTYLFKMQFLYQFPLHRLTYK